MNKFLKAFNQDTILQKKYIELVEKYSPDVLIETGTYEGDTTEFFSSFNLPVLTTEWFEHNALIAREKLKNKNNVSILVGDSATELEKKLDFLEDKKIIIFLDSHGQEDFSCERELEFLAKLSVKPVIIIHDFNVPNKLFQGGNYDNHPYDYSYFKKYFDLIYGEFGYTYEYNKESNGNPKVGVIILEPKILI